MRFTFLCLVYAALKLSTSEAFSNNNAIAPTTNARLQKVLFSSLQGGWDNDSFMDSLGQGAAQQQQANDAYYEKAKFGRPEEQPWAADYAPPATQPSEPPPPPPVAEDLPARVAEDGSTLLPSQDVTGATFTEEMRAEVKASHTPEEEASQGGQMFRNLMNRAKQSAAAQLGPQQIPPNAMDLSIEEQARLFREIMAQRQQQFLQQPPPPPSPYNTPYGAPNPYAQAQQQQFPGQFAQQINHYGQQTSPYPQQAANPYPQQSLMPNPFGAPQQQQSNPYSGQPGADPYGQQQPPPPNPNVAAAGSDPYSQQLAAAYSQQLSQSPPTSPNTAPPQPPTAPKPSAPQQQATDPYSQQLAAAYAQQGQTLMPISMNPQSNPNMQQYSQPPPPPPNPYAQQPQQQNPQMAASPYNTPQQQQQMIYPEQQQSQARNNFLEPGVGFDGRKIGRNKDADVVANTSDAYFAQLKRDSMTRNLARYAGDDVKANDVFHDPAIKDIKAPNNPYVEERRQRERDMLETVPEEMLIFQEYNDEPEEMPKATPSYKDKLAQFKAKRDANRGGGLS